MSTGSFSRPGAFDLSALASRQPPARGDGPGSGPPAVTGSFSVDVTETLFERVVEDSLRHPVVISFWSPQSAASVQLNQTLERLADEFAGQFLLAKIDVDAQPQIASAVGVPGVPLVAVALRGQLAPLLQEPMPEAELRSVLQQVMQAAVTNGVTGGATPQPVEEGVEMVDEPGGDPRFVDAEDAMERGDVEAAITAYETVLAHSPGDAEATAGLARTKLVARTMGADPGEARASADAQPDDVDAQALQADLEVLAGSLDAAFDRMIGTVVRCNDGERDRARAHLLDLFAAVGSDDPHVRAARQRLASALF